MTRPAHFMPALAALLDALEAELLIAHPEEVQDVLRETGRAQSAACGEVRSLLNEAQAATEEGSAPIAPQDSRELHMRRDLGSYRH